jgi:hypothetical protein
MNNEIEIAVLKLLRKGCTVHQVQIEIEIILEKIKSMKLYLEAIEDADFRP